MTESTIALQKAFRALGRAQIAEQSKRFFKTGEGQYGEGDEFLGIRVPAIRKFARQNREISPAALVKLLGSRYHEERLLALLVLVDRYERESEAGRRRVYRLYMNHIDRVNGWDLVDSSAPRIVGAHLSNRSRAPLYRLARSPNLWHRRIAVLATFQFIRDSDFNDALAIASLLLGDEQDLIHKAAGWMLREIGKRNRRVEEAFLREHYQSMPRTMLRYAIEKLPEERRQAYLAGRV